MPILTLKLSANAQLPDVSALAKDLTALTERELHKRADVTSVVLQRIDADTWWVGGGAIASASASPSVPAQVLMQLDIRITQGTNTAAEKTAFVAQAFDLLSHHLAQGQWLHPTSYISVQELPATDWGYGGLTQQQRREMAQAL